jgi:hypothetical protein
VFTRSVAFLAAVALMGFSGCGPARLDETKTIQLDGGEANSIDLDPITKPQTVKAEFESTASDVTVLIFKDDVKDDQLTTEPAAKALAKETGKSGTVTAEVPANTGVRVVVRGAAAKTSVKLHVTNKK